ncbi:MAG TPA: permease, partial [Terriglobales bacterium]|nr:permease [Terriglobales bacterium]
LHANRNCGRNRLLHKEFSKSDCYNMPGYCCHAEMDMAVTEGPLFRRMLSDKGRTAISHYFVMDWVSIWKDIAGGLLLAGVLAVFVPKEGWQAFFLTSHPKPTTCWSPLVGPIVAVLLFVCSVGNVPLAPFCGTGAAVSAVCWPSFTPI